MDIMFIEEVSEMTRIPVASLRWYRLQSRGPRSFKLGARVAYKRADVERWVEEQYAGGEQVPA